MNSILWILEIGISSCEIHPFSFLSGQMLILAKSRLLPIGIQSWKKTLSEWEWKSCFINWSIEALFNLEFKSKLVHRNPEKEQRFQNRKIFFELFSSKVTYKRNIVKYLFMLRKFNNFQHFYPLYLPRKINWKQENGFSYSFLIF